MSRLLDAIAAHGGSRPDAVALSGDGATISWTELGPAIDRVAAAIKSRLPRPGPVAIALDNGPAWVIADLALIRSGRPCLPLPPFFTPAQVAHALTDAGACALIREAVAGEPGFEAAGLRLVVQQLDPPADPVDLHRSTAKITYTSGSTGAPRGVCLSLEQMEQTAASVIEALGPGHAGVHAPVLPLAVLLENVAGVYASLLAGGRCHLERLAHLGFASAFRPDFGQLATVLEGCAATSLILVPELLRGLMGALTATNRRLSGLTFVAVGGARVSPDLITRARAMGLPAYEGYGLTECASVTTLNTPGADRSGAVGRALAHLRVSVDEHGEVLVGPGPTFLGYVGGPPQVGPTRTGDLGALDADGFLSIAGRRSNTLITAFGRNVSPEWIESELLAQPEIAQAVVFGEGRTALCAVIVPSRADLDGHALDAAVSRANTRLPAYARVEAWSIGPELDAASGELTGNGRPRREVIWGRRGGAFSSRECA